MLRVLGFVLALLPAMASGAVTLQAPPSVDIGSTFEFTATGSTNPRDFATVVPKDAPAGRYADYVYLDRPGAKKLVAPGKAGAYELRVLGGDSPYPTLAAASLEVKTVGATLDGPAQVDAGRAFTVRWTGPNNERDYVAIGNAARPYITYVYTRRQNPVRLTAPETAGAYELRYILGKDDVVIARRPLVVGAVSATVSGPAQAVAGTVVEVQWTGPGNAHDYVSIVKQGAPATDAGDYAYTAGGNPAKIVAPLVAGEYEIRYSLGQSYATLARAPLKILPGRQEPGLIAVAAATPKPGDRAVEVVLDASGSMLQKLGGQRRIEIARRTLTKLATATLPAGTPFALRAFGREIDSCRTDLVLPLAPLDPAAASKTVGTLDAKNEARTAIGASLDAAIGDLQAARGERVVVMVTDGEETCAGDPPAAVRRLVAAAPRTTVHFVGFAIDDPKTAAAFRQWAALGNGSYFDARDAVALDAALTQAMQPGFDVVDASGKVVVRGRAGGDAVRVMPGTYTVRLTGASGAPQPATVKSAQTTRVKF